MAKRTKSAGRYERLLKGEIDADQYVRSLRQEVNGRYRSARTGRYVSVKHPGSDSRVVNDAGSGAA